MKKRNILLMGLLFCMAVIFVLFLPDTIRETKLTKQQEDREELLPALVKIRGNRVLGSGSIYAVTADSVVIVTAAHVLAGCEEAGCEEADCEEAGYAEAEVLFFGGKEVAAEISDISEVADVGFLTVKVSDLSEKDREMLRRVRIRRKAYNRLGKNSLLYMVDLSEEGRIMEGGVVEKSKRLEEFSVPMIYADGAAQKGMSGSAVFDEEGYFVGILVAATEYGELAILPVTEIEY